MIVHERTQLGLGAVMPPAVTALFSLYPGLKSGFEWAKGELRADVKKTVIPLVAGAYAVGGLALIVGVVALFRRRS